MFADWEKKNILSILCVFLVNKRLDEWVTEERMDLLKMELPKKDTKTPMKDAAASKLMNGSRPSSPDREVAVTVSVCQIYYNTQRREYLFLYVGFPCRIWKNKPSGPCQLKYQSCRFPGSKNRNLKQFLI